MEVSTPPTLRSDCNGGSRRKQRTPLKLCSVQLMEDEEGAEGYLLSDEEEDEEEEEEDEEDEIVLPRKRPPGDGSG